MLSICASVYVSADGCEHHFFPGKRISEREQQLFFRENENIRARIAVSFSENGNENQKKSYSRWTIMIRYVSLVPKSGENLWQLLVDLPQVFHTVLHYFY
jgi:hypothetical protein